MILNEDESVNPEKDGKGSISMRVNKYLLATGFNDLLDILNVILSTVFIAIHIFNVYQPDNTL